MANLPPGFSIVPMTDADKDVPVPSNMPEGFSTVKEPDIDPDSFLGRVGTKIGERVEKVERGTKMYEEGEITYPELAMRGFGFGIGSLFDVVGEGALTLLSEMTPDVAENWIKEQVAAGGGKLMSLEASKQLLEFYNGLSVRTKDNLGDFLNIALAAVPGGQVGKKISASGIKGEKAQLSKVVLPQSDNAVQARLAEEGLPKTMQTIRNREDAIVSTVLTIPGVSGSTGRKTMLGLLNKEIGRAGNEIKRVLAKQKMTMPKQTINTRVTQSFADFVRKNPEFTTKTYRASIDKIQDAYRLALRKYNGRPEELLQLRQDFDRITAKLFKKDVHAGDDVSRELVANVRNELNNIIEGIAPDEQIKALMRRQHHSLIARENLSYNLAKEPSWIKSAVQQVTSHPFITTGVLTGTGIGGKLMGNEALGLTALGAAGAYGLAQPVVRRVTGEALQTLPVGRGMLTGTLQEQDIQGP